MAQIDSLLATSSLLALDSPTPNQIHPSSSLPVVAIRSNPVQHSTHSLARYHFSKAPQLIVPLSHRPLSHHLQLAVLAWDCSPASTSLPLPPSSPAVTPELSPSKRWFLDIP